MGSETWYSIGSHVAVQLWLDAWGTRFSSSFVVIVLAVDPLE